MSQVYPIDPVGGDTGWSTYSFWLVTYTTKQGVVGTATQFAGSASEAINSLKATINENLYGPLTNISAAPTTGPGIE